jgi:hypothetical protein
LPFSSPPFLSLLFLWLSFLLRFPMNALRPRDWSDHFRFLNSDILEGADHKSGPSAFWPVAKLERHVTVTHAMRRFESCPASQFSREDKAR